MSELGSEPDSPRSILSVPFRSQANSAMEKDVSNNGDFSDADVKEIAVCIADRLRPLLLDGIQSMFSDFEIRLFSRFNEGYTQPGICSFGDRDGSPNSLASSCKDLLSPLKPSTLNLDTVPMSQRPDTRTSTNEGRSNTVELVGAGCWVTELAEGDQPMISEGLYSKGTNDSGRRLQAVKGRGGNKNTNSDLHLALSAMLKGLVGRQDSGVMNGVKNLEDARAKQLLAASELTPTPTLQNITDTLWAPSNKGIHGKASNRSTETSRFSQVVPCRLGGAGSGRLKDAGRTSIVSTPAATGFLEPWSSSVGNVAKTMGSSLIKGSSGDERRSSPPPNKQQEPGVKVPHPSMQERAAALSLTSLHSFLPSSSWQPKDEQWSEDSPTSFERPGQMLRVPEGDGADYHCAKSETARNDDDQYGTQLTQDSDLRDAVSSDIPTSETQFDSDDRGEACGAAKSGISYASRRSAARKQSHLMSYIGRTSGRENDDKIGVGKLRSQMLRTLVHGNVDEVQTLRHAREEELTAIITDGTGEAALRVSEPGSTATTGIALDAGGRAEHLAGSPWLLKVCGVLLWGRPGCLPHIYRVIVLFLSAVALGFCIEKVVYDDMAGVSLRFDAIFDLAIAAGSFTGLLVTRTIHDLQVLGNQSMLLAYARRQDVVDQWALVSMQQTIALIAVWVATVLIRASAILEDLNSMSWRDQALLGSQLVSSATFVCLVYCILHICSGMALLVDAYCYCVADARDINAAVYEWNMLQAVMRKASSAVEAGFLVLQTTALTAVLTTMAGFVQQTLRGWWVMVVVLLVLCDVRLFFRAAQITEKCSRVPPLINSLNFKQQGEVDPDRHYLVEYVTYSAAGFYVGEVRLTTSNALKLAYISGIMAFGVLTKVATM